ncbi:preprotein translocase subunit SecE [Penaeicola halotolerans]|uniref:preprotein translocase subunit SecE n=1 Tax=Penaeicola halotolerans TaxID=2793196 RepID=UPI001CF82ABE|nr:preprotein translocase subunit SecE [Penaeicola halotolerans]
MNIKQFVVDSIDEMRNKVTWTPFRELQGSATLVLVASLIFALLIFVIDLGFENMLTWFYNAF